MYRIEALCQLNMAAQAVEDLSSIFTLEESQPTHSIRFFDPISRSSSQAKSAFYVNLSIAHILLNDLDNAQKFANDAIALSPSFKAIRLLVYIHLRRGNTDSALQLLKRKRMANQT